MSDQTTKTSVNKTDKEKTVKKRAARSIVAPRIEEEVHSDKSSGKNNTYIPGPVKPPRQEKKAATIVSPAAVHTEPGKTRTPKVISAPAGVVMNEDKLPPEVKRPKPMQTATGWPDRPPTPRVPEKNMPVTDNAPAAGLRPAGNAVPAKKAEPEGKNIQRTNAQPVARKVQKPTVKPEGNAQQTVSVINDADGIPRKVVKTVVTTTTTTYEALTDEEISRLGTQNTAAAQPRTVKPQTVQPAVQVRQQAGTIPEPVIDRAAVQGGTVTVQPVANQAAQPVQQPAQTVVQPMQQTIPQAGQQVIQQPAVQKPMTAMDRQLAEIEKALGLSNTAIQPGVQQPQQPGAVPAVPAPGVQPGQPLPGQPGGLNEKPVMDAQTKKSMEYFMLAVEGLIFIIVLCICISIYQKIKNKDYAGGSDEGSSYEQDAGSSSEGNSDDSGTESFDVQQAGSGDELQGGTESLAGDDILAGEDILAQDGGGSAPASDSVDVDNENFTLHCTNITVTLDTNGSPAALIYFTFTNKTSSQLSMSEVFPPSVMQNGQPCDTSASLEEYPEEFYNKDMKIADGSTINCCYAVSLTDAVSPIRLTIYDNHDTFSEIGTTEIAIQ